MNEGEIEKPPIILNITKLLSVIAICLVVISQFTGIYYTFDENNIYTRSPYYFVSYVFPYFVLIIQLATLVRYRKRLRGKIALSVFLFDVVSLTASMIQLFMYGVSLVDMAAVVMVIGLYIFALLDMNERVERANQIEINKLKVEQQNLKHLFEQTVTALATAIDAKDNFTRGHSLRVAEYAREIARLSGMDEKKCDEVYFAALVHDVGKIGIKDDIIQRDSNLSDEEYEIKKKHTEIGGEILSSISEFPFLSIGAKYHHERFDGKGYSSGLSGTDIPDIARIIAVADSYDDLTSGRSYRDPLPQSTVREEIVKGQGTLFDPEYARIMVNMIDKDTEYMMREQEENINSTDHTDLSKVTEMRFEEYKNSVSDGLQITDHKTKISFKINSDLGYESRFAMPSIILFDSFDGCVHNDDRNIRVLNYIEYGEIWLDGNTICTAARDIKSTISESGSFSPKCEIEAVRIKDHVRIKIRNQNKRIDVIVALFDDVRFAFIGITGEHCKIQNITVEHDKEAVLEDYIPRIAEEVNYINNLQGDIPNVQINGYRSDITKPLPVRDGMRISFFTKSLPSANLIWHCAYVLLFAADDEKQDGTNYREFACIRIDGEDATKVKTASNELVVRKDAEFESWDVWKERNKKGFPCEITFKRRKNKITMVTSNAGISIKNTTIIPDNEKNILVALTGDQCTLTNIIVL